MYPPALGPKSNMILVSFNESRVTLDDSYLAISSVRCNIFYGVFSILPLPLPVYTGGCKLYPFVSPGGFSFFFSFCLDQHPHRLPGHAHTSRGKFTFKHCTSDRRRVFRIVLEYNMVWHGWAIHGAAGTDVVLLMWIDGWV